MSARAVLWKQSCLVVAVTGALVGLVFHLDADRRERLREAVLNTCRDDSVCLAVAQRHFERCVHMAKGDGIFSPIRDYDSLLECFNRTSGKRVFVKYDDRGNLIQ